MPILPTLFEKFLPDLIRALPFNRLFTSRYRHFFDHGLDPYAIFNMRGEFVDVNDEFCRVLGRKRGDLIGTRFMQIVHPADQPATVDAMEVLRNGGEVMDFENRYRHANMSYVRFRWRAKSNGQIIATVQVVRGK